MTRHIIIILVLMTGCMDSYLQEESQPCPFGDIKEYDLVRKSLGATKILLPSDSELMESNDLDSQYWLWRSRYGEVSFTWISEIASELLLHSPPGGYCRVQGISHEFYVWYNNEDRITAVSEPLLKGGASILVKIKLADKDSAGIAFTVIESIEFDPE